MSKKKAPRFQLEIRLGDSEMRTPEDVAISLREMADFLEKETHDCGGDLQDLNGNTVGEWSVTWPECCNFCKGRGYQHVESEAGWEIQHCEECKRYPNDEVAAKAHADCCKDPDCELPGGDKNVQR